jgi:hypothetical protein
LDVDVDDQTSDIASITEAKGIGHYRLWQQQIPSW